MAEIIKIRARDGSLVEYEDKIIGSGSMKDVYMSPDKSYVVCYFRDRQDYNTRDRLENITGTYRDRIFNQPDGKYWENLFCWPTKVVEYRGKIGVVCPTYQPIYYFKYGSVSNDILNIRGKEKEGKWYASALNQNKHLSDQEKGNWLGYLQVCISISRAVKKMHAAGLAHSDLSYKNVLIDPLTGSASIIDIDGLVVPGKYPPDVLGTPDFIAPEVISTKKLNLQDPNRKLPQMTTDRHALAIMIYMYLLFRHPLRGGKVHDLDSAKDEELTMGANALFIEHPTDASNRVKVKQLKPTQLPQGDPVKLPYTLCGPYLKALFDKAFIEGLHNPSLRPTADEWEQALLKTVDLIQPCQNKSCKNKWFVFDNTTKPRCPFCGTEYKGQLPVLNFYSSRRKDSFSTDDHRLMVFNNQSLFLWHTNRNIAPNPYQLSDEQKKRVGYFTFHQGKWLLVNERMPLMEDVTDKKKINIGEYVELTDGKQILLSSEDGGRLIIVQLVSN